MLKKLYKYPLLAGALALSIAAHADEPDTAAQAAREAAQTARANAQTARASAETARTQAEAARVDAQRELEQMRGQMRDLSRKMADLSMKMGDVGPRTYAFRYLGDPDRGMIGVVLAPDKNGLRVDAVTPGGPADKAGVRDGDVLTAIDGKKLAGEDGGDALHDLKDRPGRETGDPARRQVARGFAQGRTPRSPSFFPMRSARAGCCRRILTIKSRCKCTTQCIAHMTACVNCACSRRGGDSTSPRSIPIWAAISARTRACSCSPPTPIPTKDSNPATCCRKSADTP